MAIMNRELCKPFIIGALALLLLSCTLFPSNLLLDPRLFADDHRGSGHETASASIERIASTQTQKVPIPFGLKDTLHISSPNNTFRLPHVYSKRYDTTW